MLVETADGLVMPRYGQACLSDLLPAALAVLGVPGAIDRLGLADAGPGEAGLAGVRGIAVLLVDGLGHRQLPLAAEYAPTLRRLAAANVGARTEVITAVFPSTTPASLAGLGTGAPPGAHGLVGFTVNVPGTDRVLNHIEWVDDPDPLRWQPLTTQFDLAAGAGVDTFVVSRPEYRGSGLTRAAFRGAQYVDAAEPVELAAQILHALAGDRRVLIYGYHPDLDQAGHGYGVDSPQWRAAVVELDQLVTLILDGLPRDAALVVTADHGMINVSPSHRVDMDADPRLLAGVRLVAGDPRVRYLHTVAGAGADVAATWRELLGEAGWVASRDEVVAQGWYGPVAQQHLARIGDIVIVCRDDYALMTSRREPPSVTELVGLHGSATPAEMLVPLLLARADWSMS